MSAATEITLPVIAGHGWTTVLEARAAEILSAAPISLSKLPTATKAVTAAVTEIVSGHRLAAAASVAGHAAAVAVMFTFAFFMLFVFAVMFVMSFFAVRLFAMRLFAAGRGHFEALIH